MKSRRNFLSVILCFYSIAAFAESPTFRFTNYTTLAGLSSNATRCVFKDSRGFLWIGTEDGLNLFDGHSFKIFRHNRFDSLSLPDNFINSIAEDEKGFLWIGTNNGVAHFNSLNSHCEKFFHHDNDSLSLSDNYGNRVFIDHEQRIWVCNVRGISLFDPQTKTFHPLNYQPLNITSLVEENSNSLWLGSYGGLIHYTPSEKTFTTYLPYPPDQKTNLVTCVLIDHAGTICCGIWGGGICRFNPKSKTFECYRWNLHPENPSTVNIVSSIIETEDENYHHRLLVGTGEGLLVIDNESFPASIESVPHIIHEASNAESICGNFVRALLQDDQQIIWTGTEDGLSAVLPSQQIFRVLKNGYQGQVMRMLPADSSIYIASWYGNGLTVCDQNFRVKGSFARIPINSSSLDNGQISDVLKDEHGMLWLATFNGLVKFDPLNHQSEVFLHNENDSTSLSTNRITSIIGNSDGKFWIGTYNGGVNLFDPSTGKCIRFHSANNSASIPSDLIWIIRKDHEGRIWFGTNNGLCYYDEKRNAFINFQKEIPGIIHDIYEDRNNTLWIATNSGLYKMNSARDHADFYSIEEGLASYDVQGIMEDDEGNLWLGTPAGLTRFNPNKKFFTNYSVKNGLPDLPFQSVFYKNAEGLIYEGATNSFLVFDPKKLNATIAAPPVYFTDLRINNAPVISEKYSASSLHLKYDQNTIIVSYTAPEFNNPDAIHYLVKMDGADKNWRDEGNRNAVTYASLSPGDYVFHVKAQNADGATGEKEANIHFIIAPPFWKSWWFISLVIACIAAIFFYVVRYISTRRLREQVLILEKEKAIETERARISRDMHDDLGSGLTKIAILSEVTQRQLKQPEKAEQQLHSISDSARTLVDNLNEIIWTLNPQHDNLDSLMAYIRDYATQYFDGMETPVTFNYPSSIPPVHLSDQQRRNIFLVVKESLNNISKHAQATQVNVELKIEPGEFQILIRDNGKGFNVLNARAGGNGLKNMSQRLQNIGGKYSITSVSGKGTITTISLKR